MKNSKEYSQKIKKLFNKLKRESGKSQKPDYSDPVEAMIFAIISKYTKELTARGILKNIHSHFVDNNDLRVSRTEEIVEVIGKKLPEAEEIAVELITLLNSVFQKYDCVSLGEISAEGKRSAKETLEKFNGMTEFVCSYVMLTAIDGHAIPLTENMVEYLKKYELVDKDTTEAGIAAFLERQISANDDYTFYSLVRHDSEVSRPKAKTLFEKAAGKTKSTKKTTKKTVKKTTKKTVKKKTTKKTAKKTKKKKK